MLLSQRRRADQRIVRRGKPHPHLVVALCAIAHGTPRRVGQGFRVLAGFAE
ncbi:MAG: hypothetical protein AW07_03983 [Candidatus Accumulibacter sp. SK-11]|nr:MAG: hypothetical protein AW07_03983 [Candidatus Accumulibacter sp. SK-11]